MKRATLTIQQSEMPNNPPSPPEGEKPRTPPQQRSRLPSIAEPAQAYAVVRNQKRHKRSNKAENDPNRQAQFQRRIHNGSR